MQSHAVRAIWLTENYFPSRGGMAQSCDRIVHSLRELGVVVDVIHLSRRSAEHGEQWRVETQQAGRYVVWPVGSDSAHALNALWSVVLSTPAWAAQTHLVAFGGLLPLLAGPVFAAWLGIPLITLIRGNDFDIGMFTPGRRAVLREALERAARVCVVSQEKARKITAFYPDIQPIWIPNGIDLQSWQVLPSDRERATVWRQTVAQGRRVLGMFGQIKQKKGGLFFLETLLRSGYAGHFHLLFIGDIEEQILLWLQAHQGEIAYSCYPFMDRYQLLPYYLACDMLVIASLYDGLPNSLVEAAALGVPLLVSSAGGMADVLEDGVHGFVFLPGDFHDCRRAIELAGLASDEQLRRYGEACSALVRRRLSHWAEAECYRAVLLETLGERAKNVKGRSLSEDAERVQAEPLR